MEEEFRAWASPLMMKEERSRTGHYFSATAMAGRLYVQGTPDPAPWEPARLVYWTEEQVEAVFNPNFGDRKAHAAGGTPRGRAGVCEARAPTCT